MRTHPLRSSFWNVLQALDDNNEALKNVDNYKSAEDRVYICTGGDFADKIDNIRSSLSIATLKIETMSHLANLITSYNDKIDFKLRKQFQKMAARYIDANADKDSLSLLAEQETPAMMSQEELTTKDGDDDKEKKAWKCPKCPAAYKYEKVLRNHIDQKHALDETLDEGSFNPDCASSQDTSARAAKRKRDEGKSGGSLDRDRRLSSEISSLIQAQWTGAIDASLNPEDGAGPSRPSDQPKATQVVLSNVAASMSKAEKDMVEVDMDSEEEDPDASMRKEEAKMAQALGNQLKLKDDLLHIRNAKIFEKEGVISELKEIIDQKERQVQSAEKMLRMKEEECKKMKEDLRKRSQGQDNWVEEKERLKEDLEKADATIKNLNGKMNNLNKELKMYKLNLRKHEADHGSLEVLRTQMEATVLKIEQVEKKSEDLELENAKLKKKIPCPRDNCDRDKRCSYSHTLKYEDRREPGRKNWRKTLPCKFFNTFKGCHKTDEECDFIHEAPQVQSRRERSQSRDSEDSQESYHKLRNQRFRTLSRVGDLEPMEEESVEELSPASRQPTRRDPRTPPRRSEEEERRNAKRPRYNNDDKDRSGNGEGTASRPRPSVPEPGRRRSSSRAGTSRNSRGRSTTPRGRKFSPIRSPTEDRDVDRKTYIRAQNLLRAGMEDARREKRDRSRSEDQRPRGRWGRVQSQGRR